VMIVTAKAMIEQITPIFISPPPYGKKEKG